MCKTIYEALGVDTYILTNIDASRWQRFVNAMELMLSEQLKDSSKILLNKADLVSLDELKQVETSILKYHQGVEIILITAQEPISEDVFKKLIKEVEVLSEYEA